MLSVKFTLLEDTILSIRDNILDYNRKQGYYKDAAAKDHLLGIEG